jgi:hypothetical protein
MTSDMNYTVPQKVSYYFSIFYVITWEVTGDYNVYGAMDSGFLQKLTVAMLVKKFPALYETLKLQNVVPTVRHWTVN